MKTRYLSARRDHMSWVTSAGVWQTVNTRTTITSTRVTLLSCDDVDDLGPCTPTDRQTDHATSRHQTWNWVIFCDPATQWLTRESSDPETQLTRWPCSIMNSKCRQTFAMGKRFASFSSLFARFWKVKFWRSFIKCQYFNDGWTDFHKNIYLYIFILGFFSKTGKLGSHTGSKWWPGDPDVKDDPDDPFTRWLNDLVPCLQCMTSVAIAGV